MITISSKTHSLLACALGSLLLWSTWLLPAVARAAEGDVAQAAEPLPSGTRKSLDDLRSGMEDQRAVMVEVEENLAGLGAGDTRARSVMILRLARALNRRMQAGVAFAEAVVKAQERGYEVADYRSEATEELRTYSSHALETQGWVAEFIEPPEDAGTAAEQARRNTWIFSLLAARDALFKQLIVAMDAAHELGMDTGAEGAALRRALSERASAYSVLLALATTEIRGRKAALAVLPADAELQAQVSVGEKLVYSLAKALDSSVKMMEPLGLNTTAYRQEVIAATGEISTDFFDPGVMWLLVKGWLHRVLDVIVNEGPNLLLKLLIFVAVVLVFRRLAVLVQRVIEAALDRSQLQLSQLLRAMILSISRNLVLFIGVLIGLSQVGISLGPLLAGLGVAGFVIGFALQDTLSNFASGLMILSYRPFDVGDVVEAGGVFGKVSHMSLVSTTIHTFDNQTLVVPNNKIWGDVIKNVTSQRTRRVDLVFSISYEDDILLTERVLKDVVEADSRILKSPATMIRLSELGESSVDFIVRPWVRTADYWDVYWDLIRDVKLRFDAEGISIPYPQRDVHIVSQVPPPPAGEGPEA